MFVILQRLAGVNHAFVSVASRRFSTVSDGFDTFLAVGALIRAPSKAD
jgi:hypothetical protein